MYELHDDPMGATITHEGVEFRVWAPEAGRVDVEVDGATHQMRRDGDVWVATVADAGAGSAYGYRIDGRGPFPDPYSRFQPEGPHGRSQVVDPGAFEWHDEGWRGLRGEGLVVYEVHVGTFTPEGTFDAAAGELGRLRDLGVSAIEIMPVAEFPGGRNWGYDGVDLFAPTRNYGGPEGLRRLVDAAHGIGVGVILDVVYNHLGPDGNYLTQFARDYFNPHHHTPWGDAINYDGRNSHMVRRLVVDNACYWLREYHIDGLRLDATFAIMDESPRHILADITDAARRAVERDVVLVAETHEHEPRYVRPTAEAGFGFDAMWSDDFHHAVHTRVTGERDGYYASFPGTLESLARAINDGWLTDDRASTRSMPATAFVYALQNHDQVGNRALGERLAHLVPADTYRACSALLLLLPYTPLLFMGDEWAASSPFQYFTDHNEELGRLVTEGRRKEFAHFPSFSDPEQRSYIPDPQDEATFARSRVRLEERGEGMHAEIERLYGDLIALRRTDAVLRGQDREGLEAHAVAEDLLLVHLRSDAGERLLAVNFGEGVNTSAGAIPAEISGREWRMRLSTDARSYGGGGSEARVVGDRVTLPARTAAWFE